MKFQFCPTNIYLFIILNVIIITLFQVLLSIFPIFQNLENPSSSFLEKNVFVFLLLGVIIIPFIETLIFQAAIIGISSYLLLKIKVFSKNSVYLISIILSAVAFGFNHNFSLGYAILGFFVGLIFAFSYVISLERRWNPILVVFVIHVGCNLVAWIVDYF